MTIFFRSFISIIFICTSFSANTYQTYNFNPKQVHITEESFRRIIRPELQLIVREYYSVLKQIIPFCDELIQIKQILLSLNTDWSIWVKKCQLIDYECTVDLRTFYKKTRDLDQVIFNIQKSELSFSKSKNEHDIDSMIYSTYALTQISNNNYYLMHFMEQFLITSNTTYFRNLTNSELFIPILNRMLLTSEMMITEQIDPSYRKEFEFIWNDFIRTAERYIVLSGDKEFFMKRLEDYNIAWNDFHMRTVKSNIDLPINAQKIISHIHGRWNSILKYLIKGQ